MNQINSKIKPNETIDFFVATDDTLLTTLENIYNENEKCYLEIRHCFNDGSYKFMFFGTVEKLLKDCEKEQFSSFYVINLTNARDENGKICLSKIDILNPEWN